MEKANTVDYTAALCQFRQYGRGRSMRQFCEDEGRFLRPITSDDMKYGKISWSDFVLLTETISRPWKRVRYVDYEAV